jgi:tRNA threonylcarbamoyl adenosine modification protein (Sua5/YciO/YrdC/YwlC family)
MKTIVLQGSASGSLERARDALRGGSLIAFPTDTVYGIGALAFDAAAVERIYIAKRRPSEKAIPILIGTEEDMSLVAVRVSETARRLRRRFWPGPLTLVVPKHPQVPDAVAESTVGVRLPDHPVTRELLRLTGPMAVTSANVSGQPSAVTADEVLSQLAGHLELILDGGRTPGGVPSTVVDCTRPDLAVLRSGPISLEDLEGALV